MKNAGIKYLLASSLFLILPPVLSIYVNAAHGNFMVSGSFLEEKVPPDSPMEKYMAVETFSPTEPARIDIFNISDDKFSKVDTISTIQGSFQFIDVPQGEYLIQVVVPGFLPHKKKISLDSDFNSEFKLRRPIDYGNGPVPAGTTPRFAGAGHAFGCNVVTQIFVQWSGDSTWTEALQTAARDAASSGMSDFEAQAPNGAKFRSIVENLGPYTVTSPIGNTCSAAKNWIEEVLDDMGYTSGTVDSRLDALAQARASARCGNVSYCQSCGLESSGFLFFITRNNADPQGVGGWNCGGGRYQISYFGRSNDPEVYTHEIGHAFGTTDEYCTILSNFGWYCCGWLHQTWGCDATGGCLNGPNSNCDPVCGQDCDPNAEGMQDCQDGCPLANCTNHTACTMDSSPSTTFCDASRRQLGWADSDNDGYLDCLENNCGTSPSNSSSFPSCIEPFDVYVDGNWAGEELGTTAHPFNTVTEGHEGSHAGDTLHIKNGPFDERPLLDKQVNVEKWGTGPNVVIGSP